MNLPPRSISVFFCLCLIPLCLSSCGETESTSPADDLHPTINSPEGHFGQIRDLQFTPDGKRLISVSKDKTIKIWDLTGGKLNRTHTLRPPIGEGNAGQLYFGALSPKGRFLAVGGYGAKADGGGPIRIIDLKGLETGLDAKIIKLLPGHEQTITRARFSPDGKWLASASRDWTLKIWDLRGFLGNSDAGEEEPNLDAEVPVQTLEGHTKRIYAFDWSPDGNRIVSGDYDSNIFLWRRDEEGQFVRDGSLKDEAGHTNEIRSISWSPNGNWIATGAKDRRWILWDANSGEKLVSHEMSGAQVMVLGFSPDNKYLLASSQQVEGTTAIFEVPTGKQLITFDKHDNAVTAFAWSPKKSARENPVLASGGGDIFPLYLWEPLMESGEFEVLDVRTPPGHRNIDVVAFGKSDDPSEPSLEVGFSSDAGMPLEYSFDFRSLTLKKLEPSQDANGEPIDPLGFRRTIETNQEGQKLIVNREDENGNRIDHILEIGDTGKKLELNPSLDPRFKDYSWTEDGNIIAAGYYNIYYHKEDTTLIHPPLKGHQGQHFSVSPSQDPQSSFLASGAVDQTVRLWNLKEGILLASLHVAGEDWICWTPEGYFACSPGGEYLIGWQVNQGDDGLAKFYLADALYDKFHRPSIIRESIQKGKPAKEIVKRWVEDGRMDEPPTLEEALQSAPASRIVTDLSNLAELAPGTTVEVQVEAEVSSGKGLQEIGLSINGRPLPGTESIDQTRSVGTQNFTFTIPDEPQIVLEPSATSEVGTYTRGPLTVIRGSGSESPPPAHLWILGVSVNNYDSNHFTDLLYCHNDVEKLIEAFDKRKENVFASIKETPFLPDATLADIQGNFGDLATKVEPHDTFIFVYAGHGIVYDKEFYLVPADAQVRSDESNAVTASQDTFLSATELRRLLNSINANNKFVLLDTCHSGAFIKLNKESVDVFSKRSNTAILASSGAESVSRSSSSLGGIGHGYFSYTVLEAVEKGRAASYWPDIKELYPLSIANYCTRFLPHKTSDQIPKFHPAEHADFPVGWVSEQPQR